MIKYRNITDISLVTDTISITDPPLLHNEHRFLLIYLQKYCFQSKFLFRHTSMVKTRGKTTTNVIDG